MAVVTSALTSIPTTIFALTALYVLLLILWRLYLSPLSKFPGPKLAAATHWYQRYFDLAAKRHGGQFLWEINRLHKKYGPIVRVTPDELHIDDPEYWHEVYCQTSTAKPIDKQTKLRYRFGLPDAVFSTPRAEQHRSRRQAMAGFFSRQRLRESQDRVNQLVDRVSRRLSKEYAGTNRVLYVGDMLSCLAIDIVTELCFRRCTNYTEVPEFNPPFVRVTINNIWMVHWTAHFGRFVLALIEKLPASIMLSLVPLMKPVHEFKTSINEQVNEILSGIDQNSLKTKSYRSSDHATMFDDILASNLPDSELSFNRLSQEAMALTTAGMETVKSTITLAIVHLLEKPNVGNCLREELMQAMPNPDIILPWFELEKLPYLTAVINESLRLSYGTVQRSPRINRLHSMSFGRWTIPPGTAIGMDSYHMHTNPKIFPEPFTFRPERWLHDPKGPDGRQPLTNYLTSFGGGSRICIAMHLAYMEMFVTLAVIFRRHEFQLFETDVSDVELALEMLSPMPRRESKGVRVTVSK